MMPNFNNICASIKSPIKQGDNGQQINITIEIKINGPHFEDRF